VISESLKKASLEILVLAMLNNEDTYPYQMVQTLKAESDTKYSLVAGVIYPTLYRLQDKGYVTCRVEQVGKRRLVHVYHLEDAGREYLREQYENFLVVSNLIQSMMNKRDEG